MEQRKHIRLDEVTLMRTFLAMFIVFMHSFTCYQGGWVPPEGYVDIPIYKWIARTSFAFTLEAFVFISGYLFAFQRITLQRKDRLGNLVFNKLKRLILPSIIFSVIYFPLFCKYKSIGDLFYNLINGCGHMWFLPMLFWCFIGCYLLEYIKIDDGWKLFFLILLNLLPSFLSLPLRISETANYLFYFFIGYVVYKQRDFIIVMITPKRIILCWIIFVVVFVLFRPLKETITIGDQTRIFRLLSSSARKACRLVYATTGTFAFYITAVWYAKHHQLKAFTVKLASCCFGIYLFHQFILRGLYYKTSFSTVIGPYWLPWFGFVIAALLSYLFAVLLLKTKAGKYIIG